MNSNAEAKRFKLPARQEDVGALSVDSRVLQVGVNVSREQIDAKRVHVQAFHVGIDA